MRTHDSISFDTSGFAPQSERDGARVWWTSAGDGIGLYYFDKSPDIGAVLHSINDVRTFFRNRSVNQGLGMIEVETPQINGCLALRTIFKSHWYDICRVDHLAVPGFQLRPESAMYGDWNHWYTRVGCVGPDDGIWTSQVAKVWPWSATVAHCRFGCKNPTTRRHPHR
jgi:hypothetical protein